MSFQDQMRSDLDMMFNLDEFAEEHTINGRTRKIIIDNDRLMQRSKQEFDGISVGELLYYVRASEYGAPPKVNEKQTFDRKLMTVFDVRMDSGLYEIILQNNQV